MRKFFKRTTGIVLACAMSISLCNANITKSTKVKADNKTVFDEIVKTSISENKLERIAETALEDGEKAANLVNRYDDAVDYDEALNYALTSYYETEDFDQLDEFEKTVDSRSEDVIAGYKKAAKERAKGDANGYEAGKVIAMFDKDATEEEIDAVCKAQHGEVESIYKDFTGDYVATISISLGQTVDMATEAYGDYSITEAVDSNNYYDVVGESVLNATNDTDLSKQYYLDNIHVKEAWDYVSTHTHDKVLVGVIDTGVQIDHPDLKNSISPNSADITGNSPVLLKDCAVPAKTWHGTGVASLIAAEANNNRQVAGVASCYNNDVVEILAVQASTYYESYKQYRFSVENLNRAMDYCAKQGVKVINMSLGGFSYDSVQEATINKLTEAGIIIVCAAGNESSDEIYYPSDFEKTISVVATTQGNYIAGFSNFGKQKNICAPGMDIYMLTTNSGAVYGEGTSMASPIVAAVTAMMCSINSDLNYFDVKRIMANTASDLANESISKAVPYGVVNAAKCIEYAVGYTPETLFKFEEATYQNVARGKNVTASSVFNADGFPLTNLVDGNTSTKCITESSSGQYVKVDLGQEYDIDKINLYYERFSTTAYRILVSKDDENWTEIASGEKAAQSSKSFEIEKQKARYVKVEFIDNDTYVILTELEVYGDVESKIEYKDILNEKEKPLEVIDMRAAWIFPNSANVSWTTDANRALKNYTYNVYVDGQLVQSGMTVNHLIVSVSRPGYHTFKVTSNLNGMESQGKIYNAYVGSSMPPTTTEAPTTTNAPTEEPTTIVEETPLEVIGMNVSCTADNTIGVVWGQDADRINSGCKYNVYVNGTKVLSEVICNYYTINNIEAGNVQVKVTAVLNGIESAGVTQTVNVTGSVVETTTEAPTTNETTTEAPTTTITEEEPLEVIGMNATCTKDNTIEVVWGQDTDRINSGCKYNVYINDVKKYNEVVCARYTIENINAGSVTVKVTAVLNGKESAGVVQTVQVSGTAIEPVTTEISTESQYTISDINIARDKNVYSSSNESDELMAGNVTDGSMSTRWSSAWTDNEWIYVDLGESYDIAKVKLFWEGAFATNFKLQVSNDAENWTDVAVLGDTYCKDYDVEFAPVNARYVKMQGVNRGTEYGYSLFEIEVYAAEYENVSPNVQLISNGKNVVASSSEGDDLSADKVVDGDTSTRWSSAWTDNEWIYVDLGSEKYVSSAEFIWEDAYASQYSVQVSSDGVHWTTVDTVNNGNGGTEKININANARYVKMQGIKRNTEYGYSLYEMNVYGY